MEERLERCSVARSIKWLRSSVLRLLSKQEKHSVGDVRAPGKKTCWGEQWPTDVLAFALTILAILSPPVFIVLSAILGSDRLWRWKNCLHGVIIIRHLVYTWKIYCFFVTIARNVAAILNVSSSEALPKHTDQLLRKFISYFSTIIIINARWHQSHLRTQIRAHRFSE